MLTLTLPLSLSPNTPPLRIPVAQNDSQSRTLIFRLTAPSGAPNLPDGAIVTMDGHQARRQELLPHGTLANDRATVTLTRQMCAVAREVALPADHHPWGRNPWQRAVFPDGAGGRDPHGPPTSAPPSLPPSRSSAIRPRAGSPPPPKVPPPPQTPHPPPHRWWKPTIRISPPCYASGGKANICPAAAPGNLAGLGTHGQLMDLGFRVNVGTWTPWSPAPRATPAKLEPIVTSATWRSSNSPSMAASAAM